MNYVGVLCVEFFVLADGRLLVNEIAPRPHNSGHYTIDACVTSQFEQQARVMAGLPLGDTTQAMPSVMLNILGDAWYDGATRREPDWSSVVAVPGAKLHLYGKTRGAARPQDGPRDRAWRRRSTKPSRAPTASRRSSASKARADVDAPAVDSARIAQAVEVLKRGGLVAVPTETVYGLAADATNEAAVRAIFAAKGRPADHPVIVHVADASAIDDWAREVPDSARALAAAFWPGPLTLVLKRSPRALDVVTGGQDTVGLRCPAHPWARALLQAFGGALAAPSANRFGHLSPTTAEHVRADLGEKPAGAVDLILDGGACPVGIESTIVDLSGAQPTLLRPGSITRLALEQVLGVPVAEPGATHRALRADLNGTTRRARRSRSCRSIGSAAGWRRCSTCASRCSRRPWSCRRCAHSRPSQIAAPEDPVAYARELYANLHELDQAAADRIVVSAPPSGPEWTAIHDRLRRAQAGSRPR